MKMNLLKDKLNKTKPYINGWQKMKRAAILIPLVEINDEIHMMFEVRAQKMNSQPGDICYPGGKIDYDETPKMCVLREIDEELEVKNVEIINELNTVVRHDGILIHPFVGIIKDINEIKINKDEVDHIFYIPLSYFKNYKPLEVYSKLVVQRSIDFPYDLIVNKENYKFREGNYRSLFFKYNDYSIWGITADILDDFLIHL